MQEFHYFAVICLLGLLTGVGLAGDATQVFDQLYGQQVKAALATRDSADDLTLAARLLNAARQSTETPALLKQLCDHTYDLAARFPAGFDTADAAMQLLADNTPVGSTDQMTAFDKLVTLRRREYIISRGEAKAKAGEAYIDVLTALAHATSTTNADTAGNDLRQALGVASAIHSPRAEAIRKQYDQLNAIRILQHRVADLRDQLKKDPKNAKAAEDLIMLYVVDLDEPAEAAKLTFLLPGSDWAKNLPLAVLEPSKLTLAEASSLGDWYRGLAAKETNVDAKAAMLHHADADYQQALASHPDNSLQAQKLNLLLSDVQGQLTRLGFSPVVPPTQSHTASPPPTIIASGQSIDLLSLIDLPNDNIRGKWSMTDGVLRGSTQPASLLELPASVHGDYRIEADFARLGSLDMIAFLLPVGHRQVIFAVDSDPGLGCFSGLRRVDGHVLFNGDNPTARKGQLTADGHKLGHLTLEVHVDTDQANIDASFDGNTILKWHGRISSLSLEPDFKIPDSNTLGLVVWNANYEVRSLRLQMLSGSAVPIIIPPMAKLAPAGPPSYLSDMQERDVHVLNFHGTPMFGKGGVGPDDTGPIQVAGVHSPHGLFTHPATGDPAHVSYALDGQYHLLRGAIGVSDSAADPQSALWFTVLGDGKILWRSRPLQRRGVVQPFNIDVSGIKMLELRVWVAGGDSSAHASWVEPALYRAARRTSEVQLRQFNDQGGAPPHSSNHGAIVTKPNKVNSDAGGDNGKFFGIPTN